MPQTPGTDKKMHLLLLEHELTPEQGVGVGVPPPQELPQVGSLAVFRLPRMLQVLEKVTSQLMLYLSQPTHAVAQREPTKHCPVEALCLISCCFCDIITVRGIAAAMMRITIILTVLEELDIEINSSAFFKRFPIVITIRIRRKSGFVNKQWGNPKILNKITIKIPNGKWKISLLYFHYDFIG